MLSNVKKSVGNIKYDYDTTLEQRISECKNIMSKYPDRIPILVGKMKNSKTAKIDKEKFLVPWAFTMGQFMHVIRKRLKLNPEMALFLFVNGCMPPSTSPLMKIYEEHKGRDGFLRIIYSEENTFGA